MSEHNQEPRKYLMSDESFALLSAAQNKICDAVEVVIPVRRMINALVTPEAVDEMVEIFIKKYE